MITYMGTGSWIRDVSRTFKSYLHALHKYLWIYMYLCVCVCVCVCVWFLWSSCSFGWWSIVAILSSRPAGRRPSSHAVEYSLLLEWMTMTFSICTILYYNRLFTYIFSTLFVSRKQSTTGTVVSWLIEIYSPSSNFLNSPVTWVYPLTSKFSNYLVVITSHSK